MVKEIGPDNRYGPMIVLSIKGTASFVDGIVNLNGQKKPVGSLIVSVTVDYFT